MGMQSKSSRVRALSFEQCEERILTTLVFVLNGNAFGAAAPTSLTARAAQILRNAGHQAVQVAYPTMATPVAFESLVRQIKTLSDGQTIGIVGFSAGGPLALRLATDPALHAAAVLNYYGPLDLNDYIQYRKSDRFTRYIRQHAPLNRAAINLLSGPITTSAHVVSAFGSNDRNVVATQSVHSLGRDLPQGSSYLYAGGHGVGISACPPALNEFLANL